MARHSIEIPINKSSNDSSSLVGSFAANTLTTHNFPRVSGELYLGNASSIGLAWDNTSIPSNKNIVSAVLNLRSYKTIGGTKILKYGEFAEGSKMPSKSPLDKVITLSSDWNAISLPLPIIINSVIIGVDFVFETDFFDYTTFDSSRATSNRPYLVVTYDDIPPDKPTSLYPSSTTVSTRDIIRFAWLHNSREGLNQKAFTLQYSTDSGSTWTTVTQTTPDQYYDLLANTLPTSGTVTWKVMTVDDNDEVSIYTSSSFTLGIVPQSPPIPIAPIGQYIDEKNPIRFEWNFVGGSSGETQSKFDLQYSTDGGTMWTTKTETSINKYYELAAKTLSSGNIIWRVRTYNNWGEVSPYSEDRSFTVIGSPPIPLISVISNSGLPLIKWQSQEQHLYELQIVEADKIIFDNGTIPSTTEREYKLKEYLKDGNYKARIRVYNEFNFKSEWAEKNFTISTAKPLKPIIEVFNGEYTVAIDIINISAKNLIYRDNILIGEVNGNKFIDYTGKNNKEYKYFVRAIDSSDNFADSEIKLGSCKFSGNTLATKREPSKFIRLKYGLNNIPKKTNIINTLGILNFYDGREYPVMEYSEFSSLEKNLTFSLRTREEIEELRELINKKETLIYRDFDGEIIIGNIIMLTDEKTMFGYDVNFTIIKTEV